MDTLTVVAVLFFSIGYAALMVMFTIKQRKFNSVIKEMAEKLEEEQSHSSKLWHQLDDAYAAKEELRKELDDAEHAAMIAESAWKNWERNYRALRFQFEGAIRRGDAFKEKALTEIADLSQEINLNEKLIEHYYEELQNATELLRLQKWAAKTEIAAKPKTVVQPTVQPQLATLLAAASMSPQLKRMLGL